MLLASTIEFELTRMFPSAPEVPETRLTREPEESVSTLAVIPTPDELMADAKPASVLSDEFSAMVCCAPLLPTCSVIDPDRESEALVMGAR